MHLTVAWIEVNRSRRSGPAGLLAAEYVRRVGQFEPCEERAFATEAAFLLAQETRAGKPKPFVILCDSAGTMLSSREFAHRLGGLRDAGQRTVTLAIGPADGWSTGARARGDLLLSFGPMTLPHALARVVLAEQIYRAMTILAGHPYHTGH